VAELQFQELRKEAIGFGKFVSDGFEIPGNVPHYSTFLCRCHFSRSLSALIQSQGIKLEKGIPGVGFLGQLTFFFGYGCLKIFAIDTPLGFGVLGPWDEL
jgi:hypothetical protein